MQKSPHPLSTPPAGSLGKSVTGSQWEADRLASQDNKLQEKSGDQSGLLAQHLLLSVQGRAFLTAVKVLSGLW